jgi:hypothetical protein
LSKEGDLELVLGHQEIIECKVEGGMPSPRVSWMLVDTNFLEKIQPSNLIEQPKRVEFSKSLIVLNRTSNFQINTSVSTSWGSPSLIYSNKLILNATIDLVEKTLVCVVEHALLDKPVIKSVKMELKCNSKFYLDNEFYYIS